MQLSIRKIIIAIVIFVVLGIAAYLFVQPETGTVAISSDEGATISVTQTKGGEFRTIGTTEANFESSEAGSVYVMTELDGRTTLASADLVPGETTTISTTHQPLGEATVIADGSLTSIFEEGEVVYGINPATRSLDAVRKDGERIAFSFFNIPFVKRVAWQNSENFLYETFGQGVGRVINGEVDENFSRQLARYYSFTRHNNGPIALLGGNGISILSSVRDSSIDPLANITLSGTPVLDSDENNIYYATTQFEEVDDEGDVPAATESQVIVYQYDGTKRYELVFKPIATPRGIVELSEQNKYAVLSEDGITLIDRQRDLAELSNIYLVAVNDIKTIDNRVFVLSDMGLWEFDTSARQLYLLARYPENQSYVPNSLKVDGSDLLYSTEVTSFSLGQVETDKIYRFTPPLSE